MDGKRNNINCVETNKRKKNDKKGCENETNHAKAVDHASGCDTSKTGDRQQQPLV